MLFHPSHHGLPADGAGRLVPRPGVVSVAALELLGLSGLEERPEVIVEAHEPFATRFQIVR